MNTYIMMLQGRSLGVEWQYTTTHGSDDLAMQYAKSTALQVLSEWPRYKWLLLFRVSEDKDGLNQLVATYELADPCVRIST